MNKDTLIYCEHFNFFGSIEALKEHIEDIGESENFNTITVSKATLQPFMTVNDDWLINLISREVEHQGCDNERSSEDGDEMEKVEAVLLNNIKIDYEAIMAKMPKLYYSGGKEIQIDLSNF